MPALASRLLLLSALAVGVTAPAHATEIRFGFTAVVESGGTPFGLAPGEPFEGFYAFTPDGSTVLAEVSLPSGTLQIVPPGDPPFGGQSFAQNDWVDPLNGGPTLDRFNAVVFGSATLGGVTKSGGLLLFLSDEDATVFQEDGFLTTPPPLGPFELRALVVAWGVGEDLVTLDSTLTSLFLIPEPGTAGLVLPALVGISACHRRRGHVRG
jgi:hypothetical protein